MMYGPLELRAKGKTVEQIVTDALSATGLSDIALATSLLDSDERFTTGDKLKRWVPADCAGLVAETLQRKVERKATKKAARGGMGYRPRVAWAAVDAAATSGDGAPAAYAESHSPAYSRSGAPVRGRGGLRGRGRGGAVPGAAPALRARIAVEDTTQSAQRYVDQLNVGGDDDGESDEEDDVESRDASEDGEVARGGVAAGPAEGGASQRGVPDVVVEQAEAGAAAGATPAPAARAAVLESYFFSPPAGGASMGGGGGADLSRCVLVDRAGSSQLKECALLGVLSPPPPPAAAAAVPEPSPPPSFVFLNTHQPFCLVTVGVQGGGKSHTLACVLESVLLHSSTPDDEEGGGSGVVKLVAPQNALVLHYDQNVSSVCEATGLVHPHPTLVRALRRAGAGPPAAALPRERMVVLVSPSYYLQRKAFYGDYCDVRPLLFRW